MSGSAMFDRGEWHDRPCYAPDYPRLGYDNVPTADELPGELDAPAPPLQVKVGDWTYPGVECRAGCGRVVPAARGICDPCLDAYHDAQH